MGGSHWARLGLAAVLGFVACAALGQTPSLTLIGIPPDRINSGLVAVSADGTTAVGRTLGNDAFTRGLTWTRSGGLDECGGAPGIPLGTEPRGVSATGATVVGTRSFQQGTSFRFEAFRYSGGTYQTLGTPPSPFVDSSASGVSGDGSVIVGTVNRPGEAGAMRWTQATGMQNIGRPAGTISAGFTGISRDGSTLIGVALPDFNGNEAYSWTQEGGGGTCLCRRASGQTTAPPLPPRTWTER